MKDPSIHGLEMSNDGIIHDCNIVVNHKCNKRCKTCIDKFLLSTDKEVTPELVEKYISKIHRKYTNLTKEVFLLGGEPTCSSLDLLKTISEISKDFKLEPKMSTNGLNRDKVLALKDDYDLFQITARNEDDIAFYRQIADRVTIKFNGDADFNLEKLEWFVKASEGYFQRSINMFHTLDGSKQLCTDQRVWDLITPLRSESHLMYHVAWYKGVRIKWGSPGCTQVEKCPASPILYPNGNYNCTWVNEDLDDYLDLDW